MATFAQLALFGTDDLQSGLAESLITASPGIGALPVVRVSGNAFTYTRVTDNGVAGVVAADGTLSGATSPTVKQVTVQLGGFYGQEDIPNINLKQGVGANQGTNPKAFYVNNAIKQVSNAFMGKMITGVNGTGTDQFDGIKTTLATAEFDGQRVTGTSDFLDNIDDAKSRVLAGEQIVIMGNAAAERKFKVAYRALGGASIVEVNGQIFQAYDGAIFVRNDFITTTAGKTDVYVLSFGGNGVQMVVPNGDIFDYSEESFLEGKHATRLRVVLAAAIMIGSVQSIAVVKDVTVS